MPAPTVTSSNYVIMGTNADGSRYIRYTFGLSDGTEQCVDNTATPAAADLNAAMAQYAQQVNAQYAYVPSPVPSWAARQVVTAAGLKSAVETAVANASAAVQTLWYTSANIDRGDPNLISLGTAIGLTSDQLDSLFKQAAQLAGVS